MTDTVFFLGAGASYESGAPLMADFLDRAGDLLKQGEVPSARESFAAVFRAVGALQRVHSKAEFDIKNLESVFAAFEMAQTLGTFGDYTSDQIDALVPAMRAVIVHTLEATQRFPLNDKFLPLPPHPYLPFASLLRALAHEPGPKHSIAVLTFNYDLALDFALHVLRIPFHYGLSPAAPPGAMPYLKLHGSLNWALCDTCGVVSIPVEEYAPFTPSGRDTIRVEIGSRLQSIKHGHPLSDEAVIVPPTANKAGYRKSVLPVWRHAAKALGLATNIVVIGYSLPDSDSFFRSLYALGTVGDAPLRRFWVFDPDPSGGVEARFRMLLGPGARERFRMIRVPFGEAINVIAKDFGVPLI